MVQQQAPLWVQGVSQVRVFRLFINLSWKLALFILSFAVNARPWLFYNSCPQFGALSASGRTGAFFHSAIWMKIILFWNIKLPAAAPETKDHTYKASTLSVLEVSDPKICILAHLMSPLEPLDPALESPLSHPLIKQRNIATELLNEVNWLSLDWICSYSALPCRFNKGIMHKAVCCSQTWNDMVFN